MTHRAFELRTSTPEALIPALAEQVGAAQLTELGESAAFLRQLRASDSRYDRGSRVRRKSLSAR